MSDRTAKPVYASGQIVETLTTHWHESEDARFWTGDVAFSIDSHLTLRAGDEAAGRVPMSEAMRAGALEAFELWDEVIALDLTHASDPAQAEIALNHSDATGNSSYSLVWARGGVEHRAITHAEIWFAAGWRTLDDPTDFAPGAQGFQSYLHEIGHAIGLSHPGHYDGYGEFDAHAEYAQDTRQFTVMSYFEAGANGNGADHVGGDSVRSHAATPLLHDILALQAVYGANRETRSTDTVYGFNSTAGRDAFDFAINLQPVVAIWDAGGIDTLDLSGFAGPQTVSLEAGTFSSVGGLSLNLAIAHGAEIENATGGAGNDRLSGNALDNRLDGGAGDDILFGGAGDDSFVFSTGADRLRDFASGDRLISPDAIALLATARETGEGALLADGAGSILLEGLARSDLTIRNGAIELARRDEAPAAFIVQIDATEPLSRVALLYEIAFGRPGDDAGLVFWSEALADGLPLTQAANAFAQAPEFAARFGAALDDNGFVETLYRNALDRDGAAPGIAFWTGQLASGSSRGDVLAAFVDSAELSHERTAQHEDWLL